MTDQQTTPAQQDILTHYQMWADALRSKTTKLEHLQKKLDSVIRSIHSSIENFQADQSLIQKLS